MNKTNWWDKPVMITYGQIVVGIATWCVLDFVAALWKYL